MSIAPDWLTDEVKHMSESETACEYCGISYLLLSKYEMLQTELSSLKEYVSERPEILRKLELLSGAISTLQAQRKELDDEVSLKKDLLVAKDSEINNLSADKRVLLNEFVILDCLIIFLGSVAK